MRDDHTQPTANRVTHERSLIQVLASVTAVIQCLGTIIATPMSIARKIGLNFYEDQWLLMQNPGRLVP